MFFYETDIIIAQYSMKNMIKFSQQPCWIGTKIQISETKGQLISKWFFRVVDFLQKTNENQWTWGLIELKSNLFVRFLEEIDEPKNHFEINWPLAHRTARYNQNLEKIRQ